MASPVVSVTIYSGAVIQVPSKYQKEIKRRNQLVNGDLSSAQYHCEFGSALKKVAADEAAAKEYTEAGKLYVRQGRNDKAYRCFKKAIGIQWRLIEPHELMAYLCRTLGFKKQALKYFKSAGIISKRSKNFFEASCYYEEALLLTSPNTALNTSLSLTKSFCIFHSSFPLDHHERTKRAVAILQPLTNTLQGSEKANIFYRLGLYYRSIDLLLAKKIFLNCIRCELNEYESFSDELFPFAYEAIKSLEEIDESNATQVIRRFLNMIQEIPRFLKYGTPMEVDNIEEMIKICDDMLRLGEFSGVVLEKKAFLLSAKSKGIVSAKKIDWISIEDNVDIPTYNTFLRLLPKKHSRRKIYFSAIHTGEMGHPNENGSLEKIITNAIDSQISWKEFHDYVYSELLKVKKFSYTYYFRYWAEGMGFVAGVRNRINSEHLLFFSLFHLNSRTFQRMLDACDEPLMKIRDSNDNTLIHVAACFGLNEHVKALMIKASKTGELSELINSRNRDGTNPLGMLFLNTSLIEEKIMKAAQLFIREPSFKINSYLNNKKGMDFGAENSLKQIGGLTCLHVALKRGLESVLGLLHQRNSSSSVSAHSNELVNMAFPSLNPDHHMNSPNKFISDDAPNKANLEQFLAERQAENEQADLDDSSGDSDDEEAPAFHHKKALQDLASIVTSEKAPVSPPLLRKLNTNHEDQITLEELEQLEKDHSKLAVVHFHGVPFMKGHYTNFQRRFVGRKIQEINKDGKLERFKAIHSRTSTATAGIQTLYDVMTASDKQLEDLEANDEKLRSAMAHLWIAKEKKFIGALGEYIYNFSQNPIQPFWNAFPNKVANVVRYRFPICSVSKAPDHAVKFAAGENVETQSLGEESMNPNYNNEGKPRHRLAGLLHVTFHSVSDMHQLQNSCALADLAQLRCSGQMSTSQSRTDHQLEVSFFGGISGKDVKIIIPIIYPNLSKEFKKGYHDVIWGLGPVDFRTKRFDFDMLKHSFTNFALKMVRALADREGLAVCYIDEINKLQRFPTALKSGKKDLSPAQLEIRQGTVTYSGVKKDQLTETTPEELSQSTASKQLSSSSLLKRETEARSKKRIDF